MDLDQWLMVVRAARERTGVVTAESVREAALDTGLAAELLAERASTLSRLGARLDATVARLAEIATSTAPDDERLAEDQAARRHLRELRWELQVVKEAMGLRGVRADIDATWPIPPPLRLGA